MSKSVDLFKRLGARDDDTIASFERAAAARLRDATVLRRADRRLSAVYLYGYAVEMWIRAAYFRTLYRSTGQPDTTPFRREHRERAVNEWKALGLQKRPGPHDIEGWARLVVRKREQLARRAGSDVQLYESEFANEIVNRAVILSLVWREYMRYRSPNVRAGEARSAAVEAAWFKKSYGNM